MLVLLGNGDGTFQPYHEANQAIALAVADLTGNGSKDIIYADQGLDRVVVDYGAGNSTVLANQSTGLLAPGAVALADLNGDGIPDLIVANSGSNNVLIYPGLGNGQFGPAINGGNGYFVGTNPVGITVANLTGRPARPGGRRQGLQPGRRSCSTNRRGSIQLHGRAAAEFRRLGPGLHGRRQLHRRQPIPDILVTNSGSNNVTLLPGVGQGFFNDTNPATFAVGTDPGAELRRQLRRPDRPGDGQRRVERPDADLRLQRPGSGDHARSLPAASIRTTAFAFESGSGFEDLVVGNTGDGVLALFEGGAGRVDPGVDAGRARPSEPDGAGLLGADRRAGPVLRGHRGPRGGRSGGTQPRRRHFV